MRGVMSNLFCRRTEAALVQDALPRAPPAEKQTVQNLPIWYTTLGRLLGGSQAAHSALGRTFGWQNDVKNAAQLMTNQLCGLSTVIDRLWYVLEVDKMALALNGSWSKQEAPLKMTSCA
jgi:hypothetical protein